MAKKQAPAPHIWDSSNFVLQLCTENEAFGETRADAIEEIARLLQVAADKLRRDPNYPMFQSLLDSNGNAVGTFRFTNADGAP